MSLVRFRLWAPFAGLAHLVERHLAKVEVASSSLVARSILNRTSGLDVLFFMRRRTRCLHRNTRSVFFESWRSGRVPANRRRRFVGCRWQVRASQPAPKRNTTHSGGESFWSTFDLRCKSPACGGFYKKAEGNPRRFPPQTPPSLRQTKDSAFVRRKELDTDTHARSAF